VREAVVTDQLGWYRPRGNILVLLTGPVRNLAVALSPWVLLAPVALPAAVLAYRRDRTRSALLLPLVWLAVTITLVALSHEQRLRYYAPVAPPMALVMGWWLGSQRVERRKDGGTRAPWAETVAGRVRGALPFVWLASVAAFAIGYHLEVTRHNAAGSYDQLLGRVRAFDGAAPVVVWGFPELPLAFYLDRTVTRVHTEPQLYAALERAPSAVVVTTESNWARSRTGETSVPRAAEAIDPAQVVLVRRAARH
jgi:4-amino-4-deoxy-L-arabinose transferase-like glycosyltransferase